MKQSLEEKKTIQLEWITWRNSIVFTYKRFNKYSTTNMSIVDIFTHESNNLYCEINHHNKLEVFISKRNSSSITYQFNWHRYEKFTFGISNLNIIFQESSNNFLRNNHRFFRSSLIFHSIWNEFPCMYF